MSSRSELSSVSFNTTNFFGEQGKAVQCIQRVPIAIKLVMLILVCSVGLFAFGLWLVIVSALEVRNSSNTVNVLNFAKQLIDFNRLVVKEALYGIHNQLASNLEYIQEAKTSKTQVDERMPIFLNAAKQFDMNKVNGWKNVTFHLSKLNEYRALAAQKLGDANTAEYLEEVYLELTKSLLTVELSMYFADPESNSESQVLLLMSRIVHEVTEEAIQGATHLVLKQHNLTALPLEAMARDTIQSAEHRDSLYELLNVMTPAFREVLRSKTEKLLAPVSAIEELFYNHTYGNNFVKNLVPSKKIDPEIWMDAFLPCIEAHLTVHDIQFNTVDAQVKNRQLNAALNIGIVIALFIFCVLVMALFSFFFSKSIVATWRHMVKVQNEMVTKFVPKDFLKLINCNSILEVELGKSQCVDLTILACDIQNFASASSVLSPQETFNFVNGVLNHMGPIIRMFDGYIDKYLGHGFVAVFKDAKKALKASIELAHAAGAFNSMHPELPAIRLVSGMHTSPCMIGTVGETMRMESAILSTSVTIANQLRSLNSKYQTKILVTKDVLNRCLAARRKSTKTADSISSITATPSPEVRNIGKICWRRMGQFTVKNINESFEFYELFEESDTKQKSKDHFDQAMTNFVGHNFENAMEHLKQVLQCDPSDATAQKLLQLSKVMVEDGDSGAASVILPEVLAKKSLCDAFERYLIQEYSIENLYAYHLIDKILQSATSEKRSLLEDLYNNYLDVKAKFMLNVNEAAIKPIRAALKDVSAAITNELVLPLQNEVSLVMMDTFKRYRHTETFKKSYKTYKTIQQTEQNSS